MPWSALLDPASSRPGFSGHRPSPCWTTKVPNSVSSDAPERPSLHPSVVPAESFTKRGFPSERLIQFSGMKEDLAFCESRYAARVPPNFPSRETRLCPPCSLRPPSETSHYRASESVRVLGLVLDYLADRDDLQVVFVPRRPSSRSCWPPENGESPPSCCPNPYRWWSCWERSTSS